MKQVKKVTMTAANGRKVTDFVRFIALDRIEDKIDLQSYRDAMADHERDPQTMTLDEVFREVNG